MELTLNIYKGREIEKTYTADSYDIMFGTVEDIIKLIDLDALTKSTDNADFVRAVGNLIVKGFDELKPLLMDIFPELTEDELRRTRVKEIVPLVMDVVKYSFTTFFPQTKQKKGK